MKKGRNEMNAGQEKGRGEKDTKGRKEGRNEDMGTTSKSAMERERWGIIPSRSLHEIVEDFGVLRLVVFGYNSHPDAHRL